MISPENASLFCKFFNFAKNKTRMRKFRTLAE